MYYLNYPALFNKYHVEISEEQRTSIINAKEYLRKVSYIEEKFDFAVGNYYDFQKALLEYSLADSIRPTFDISKLMYSERNITRYLFNLLSTIYAYTEQIKKVKRCLNLGNPDDMENYVKKFEKTNDSTKLIVTLRDHIQHKGISTNISCGSCDKSDAERTIRYLFYYNTLYLDINQFEGDKKIDLNLEKLADKKGKIEICEHLKIYFKEFCNLHEQVRKLIDEELKRNKKVILEMFDYFSSETGYKFGNGQKLLGIFSDNENGFKIFTNNTINEIEKLVSQNSNMTNIESRFACNASYTQLQNLKGM